jgi:hypothetical protein
MIGDDMDLPYPRMDVLRVRQVKYIDEPLEPGVLYVSKEFETCIHLCACGCGMKTVTPWRDMNTGWLYTETDEKVTLRPSILNRVAAGCPSNAHYYVTDNRIDWL